MHRNGSNLVDDLLSTVPTTYLMVPIFSKKVHMLTQALIQGSQNPCSELSYSLWPWPILSRVVDHWPLLSWPRLLRPAYLDDFGHWPKFEKSSFFALIWKIFNFGGNLKNHQFLPKFQKIINFGRNLKNHQFWQMAFVANIDSRLCHMLLCHLLDTICLLCRVVCCCVIDATIDTLVVGV